MTKELRERFDDTLRPYFNENVSEIVFSFLEQEMKEERRRMKERCMNAVALYYPYEAQVEAINKL